MNSNRELIGENMLKNNAVPINVDLSEKPKLKKIASLLLKIFDNVKSIEIERQFNAICIFECMCFQ